METRDPNDLLGRWNNDPRAITTDEAVEQMIQMIFDLYQRFEELDDRYTRQMTLMERGMKAFMDSTRRQIETLQKEFTVLEKAVIALEKASETRNKEMEESLSKALMEALDNYMQVIQQDILGFNARFKANEDDIRLLKKQVGGIHPTTDLFVLELATAINSIDRLFGRSRQAALILGKIRADLFQQRMDPDDFERDNDDKDTDVPPEDFTPQE